VFRPQQLNTAHRLLNRLEEPCRTACGRSIRLGFRTAPDHVADQRRHTRNIVLLERNRSAQIHDDDAEPGHPIRRVERVSRAGCEPLGHRAAEMLHQRRAGDIHGAKLSGFEHEAAIPRTMRTPQARKNTASVKAVGLIAVIPNARSTAVRTCASARWSSGFITVRERISICCAVE
jgi:hypothetical protein